MHLGSVCQRPPFRLLLNHVHSPPRSPQPRSSPTSLRRTTNGKYLRLDPVLPSTLFFPTRLYWIPVKLTYGLTLEVPPFEAERNGRRRTQESGGRASSGTRSYSATVSSRSFLKRRFTEWRRGSWRIRVFCFVRTRRSNSGVRSPGGPHVPGKKRSREPGTGGRGQNQESEARPRVPLGCERPERGSVSARSMEYRGTATYCRSPWSHLSPAAAASGVMAFRSTASSPSGVPEPPTTVSQFHPVSRRRAKEASEKGSSGSSGSALRLAICGNPGGNCRPRREEAVPGEARQCFWFAGNPLSRTRRFHPRVKAPGGPHVGGDLSKSRPPAEERHT